MIMYSTFNRGLAILIIAILVSGCSIKEYKGGAWSDNSSPFSRTTGNTTAKLMKGQKQIQQEFRGGNYSKALQIVDSLRRDSIYQHKDRVLYALDKGTISYFQGAYQNSVKAMQDAQTYIDQLFTKDAQRGIKAFFTNDTQLAYNGEVYEAIYLNGFASLSYLNMGDLEAAMVEARQIVEELAQVEAKYKKLADTYRRNARSLDRADSADKSISWKSHSPRINDSPFGHYLSAILYAKNGSEDDVRIELEKMKTAVENHQLLPDSQLAFDPAFKQVRKPRTYNTLLVAFSGMAPEKVEKRMRLEEMDQVIGLTDSMKTTLKNLEGATFEIAVPELKVHPSKVSRVEVTAGDTLLATLPMVEEMDKVAKETFEAKQSIIVTRAFFSEMLATLPQTEQAAKVRRQDKEGTMSSQLREGLARLSTEMQKVSDQADLRGWHTMPGKVFSNVAKLPQGEHTITFEYYSDSGKLLHTVRQESTIDPGEKLEPVSTIYTN